jgi:O-antigen/teichoic acid export membrane protein
LSDKTIKSGTLWTIAFFVSSFAKTILLTPLMLMHWGQELFCFWAIILSARAIILFLSDGFVRYVVNRYNLLFHLDEPAAAKVLASGISFLLVFSAGLCLLIAVLFVAFPSLSSFVFDTGNELFAFLPFCLVSYIVAASLQNVQRMYAGAKEARGLIWHNMVLEVVLVIFEILLLGLLLSGGADFSVAVYADSSIILLVALLYLIHLSVKYPLKGIFSGQSIQEGARDFAKATQLYASNFFEKLSSDGLVLLLSFFRFDKAAIALFATVRTIVNTPLLAQNLLLNTYTPEMQKHFSLGNSQALEKLLRFIRLRIGAVLCLGILLSLPLYQPVFMLWTKGEIAYNEMFMLLMLISAVFNLYGLSYSFLLKGVNAFSQSLAVMLLKSLFIIAALIFSQQSITGFALSLLLIELLTSVFLLPLLTHRFLFKNKLDFRLEISFIGFVPYLITALLLTVYLLLSVFLEFNMTL